MENLGFSDPFLSRIYYVEYLNIIILLLYVFIAPLQLQV